MAEKTLIFLALITFTFGAPINNPVKNAYANLYTADLFRITQISNNFTIIDYQTRNQINVTMDYKEKINKDILFCPRTFENPFMGYFGRNTKKEHVMCKEILYETTFKCVATNLRTECKSLKSFNSIYFLDNMEKNGSAPYTKTIDFDQNLEDYQILNITKTYSDSNEKKTEKEKEPTIQNGFVITEVMFYATIFLILGFGLGLIAASIFTKNKKFRFPKNKSTQVLENQYVAENQYVETQTPTESPKNVSTHQSLLDEE